MHQYFSKGQKKVDPWKFGTIVSKEIKYWLEELLLYHTPNKKERYLMTP
jgi:hypothetical protein